MILGSSEGEGQSGSTESQQIPLLGDVGDYHNRWEGIGFEPVQRSSHKSQENFLNLFVHIAADETKDRFLLYDNGGKSFSSGFAKYCYTCFHFLSLAISLLKTVGGTLGFLFTKMPYFQGVPYSSSARFKSTRFWLAAACSGIASASQLALGWESYVNKIRPKTSIYSAASDAGSSIDARVVRGSYKTCLFEALVVSATFLGSASNCIWTPMFLTYYADFPNKTEGDSFDFYYANGWWRFCLSIFVSLLSTLGYYFAYIQLTRDFLSSFFASLKNICSRGGADSQGTIEQGELTELLLGFVVNIYNN